MQSTGSNLFSSSYLTFGLSFKGFSAFQRYSQAPFTEKNHILIPQVYIHKRRTLIQVLPPIKFFCYLRCIYAFCLRIAIRQPMRTPWYTHTGLIAYT